MNTLAKNKQTWADYDWNTGGERWSGAFGSSEAHWHFAIKPRLHRFLPTISVCEIAPGYGRWSRYLLGECALYTGVDMTERCIESCQERFAGFPTAKFILNDGLHLESVPDGSISFVFSMDSLVHCDLPVVTSYIQEALRVLSKDGVAFFHHSNLGGCPAAQADKGSKIHWRAPSVSADIVRDVVRKSGGAAYSQELINWSETPHLIDCFTLFGPSERSDMPYRRVENPNHMQEAARVAAIRTLWCS